MKKKITKRLNVILTFYTYTNRHRLSSISSLNAIYAICMQMLQNIDKSQLLPLSGYFLNDLNHFLKTASIDLRKA